MDNFTNIRIESWPDFFETTNELKTIDSERPYWSFRGQSDESWNLMPSLARISSMFNIQDKV